MMNRVNLAKSLIAARRIEVGETITHDAVDDQVPGPRAAAQRAGAAGRPHRPPRRSTEGDFFYATDLGERRRPGPRLHVPPAVGSAGALPRLPRR